MFGISIYPEKENIQDTIKYIDLAAKYNFKRIFTCLLSVNDEKEKIKNHFSEIIQYARKKGFEVILDISPSVFERLNISYNDLSFFSEIGATGIRLDEGYDGNKESKMSYNQFNLDIEINMSSGTKYLENILSYSPNTKKIIGCHNFYPMKFSGLSLEHFKKTSKQFKEKNIRTAAFVSSNNATHGPWNVMDEGLCTLEMHRNLLLETQVKHLLMSECVDDIIIANAFASEKELEAISKLSIPTFKIKIEKNISETERKIIFDELHTYRGDVSEYIIRSTQPRLKYNKNSIIKNNLINNHEVGQVFIGNDDFYQYKGELHICRKKYNDNSNRKNLVGKIIEEEIFLIDYLKPWSIFKFEEYKG